MYVVTAVFRDDTDDTRYGPFNDEVSATLFAKKLEAKDVVMCAIPEKLFSPDESLFVG